MQAPQCERARQETGGPSGREARATGPLSADGDIDTRIIELEALTTADLRVEWRKLYRATPPTRLSRDLLMRGVEPRGAQLVERSDNDLVLARLGRGSYKIQEQAYGGLSLSIKRRLRLLSEDYDRRGRAPAAPAIVLKPGAKLVREWHEHMHTVSVLENGFEYRGEHYRSLTRIARLITGVHWSGPLFFGINKRRRARESVDE